MEGDQNASSLLQLAAKENLMASGTRPKSEVREKNPPVWSRRTFTGSGSLEVAVFEKNVDTNGGTFTAYSVSAKRTYKDGDGYKEAKGFQGPDLPHLIVLLQAAAAHIVELQNRE